MYVFYVHEQNNNSGLFVFLGDCRGAAGGGGASRPETSCAEGSVSRPAVATGGKRRRGSGSAAASSGADEVLLVLVDAILSHVRRALRLFRTDARRRTSAELTLLRHLRLGRTRPVVVAPSDCAARMRLAAWFCAPPAPATLRAVNLS